MALTPLDRDLIARCLRREPAAWQKFIDRFLALFVHAIRHTADCQSYRLTDEDIDEIASEIMTTIVANEFQVLRQFRGKSSLATYLAVIARRVCVRDISRRRKQSTVPITENTAQEKVSGNGHSVERELINRDQLEHLIGSLSMYEGKIVRAYHLDGLSYAEISKRFNVPENSIGPVLTRARECMKRIG